MQSLVFFDKEGNYLNFNYNTNLERFEGDLMFAENSSDTHKTIGLYMFENIPSFEFEDDSNLYLRKFQLFNEYGFTIDSGLYTTQSIISINSTNNDPDIYSKWIYGDDFESKFPKGTKLRFDSDILEFSNPDITYTVLDTKKGAVLILSNTDNKTFNTLYGGIVGLTSTYYNKTISSLNLIGVYDYVDSSFINNLSSWSEPDFYNSYFNDRKITLVNTDKNDGVYTVKSDTLYDNAYSEYKLPNSSFATGSNLVIELIINKGLPIIHSGYINVLSDRIELNSIPSVLKSGVQFIIQNSLLNTSTITVASVSSFIGNNTLTYYSTQSQVMWNNLVYECVQAYTQSATSSITPASASYWSNIPSYLSVVETLTPEIHLYTDMYLTTNKLYYGAGWTGSVSATLESAYRTILSDFKIFDIDVTYDYSVLTTTLVYPSKYATVNFYKDFVGSTNSIGVSDYIYESLVEVDESLVSERSKNISENYYYNIVFTDIDEYGIIVVINGVSYQQEVVWVYDGVSINLTKTIDSTIRSWLSEFYLNLIQLGVLVSVSYTGNGSSVYVNSITLQTQYPNVPLKFSILVGSTAKYYIEDINLYINDLGGLLSLNVNGKVYEQATTFISTQVPNIPLTMQKWVSAHSVVLNGYGIYATTSNSMLSLYSIEQSVDINLSIALGKTPNIGSIQYVIDRKRRGNVGSLISSNEVYLSPSASKTFEDVGFATGMITSVNNTPYPYDNQDYNILYVSPNDMILSYQGPFWGTTSSGYVQLSAYVDIAFSDGYGNTSSGITFSSFNVINNDFSSYIGSVGFVDMQYIQKNNSIYVLSDNSIFEFDSISGRYKNNIFLSGASASNVGKLVYNYTNDYLYVNSQNYFYEIYAPSNVITKYIPYSSFGISDVVINDNNGDVYVSGATNSSVVVFNYLNVTASTISLSASVTKLLYNSVDNLIFGIESNNTVVSINGSTRAVSSTYSVPGSSVYKKMYYSYPNNSVYVFGDWLTIIKSSYLYISNITAKTFNDIIYDNITGNLYLSQATSSVSNFTSIDSGTSSNVIYSITGSNYGYISISQYDGYVYMSNQATSSIVVLDPTTGSQSHIEMLAYTTSKLIYNQDRRNMWVLQPSASSIIEINYIPLLNFNAGTYSVPSNYGIYGSLAPDYVAKTSVWLETRDYIRRPRLNYYDNKDVQVKFLYKWESDDTPDIFMYDFSGNQLSTGTSYSYVGSKPLSLITLNSQANTDITKINAPEYQKTIFDELYYTLDYIDSSTNLSFMPEPIELFLGFNSKNEGAISSVLKLYMREDIGFTISSTSINNNSIDFRYITDDINGDYGIITLSSYSTDVFTSDSIGVDRGLKIGQKIAMYFKDTVNTNNAYVSFNNGKIFKIRNVYTRSIIVDFIDDLIVDENTIVTDYPSSGLTTYLDVNFTVVDKEIASFNVFGQTEIEDVRYKIELTNQGKNITSNDVFIFKSYDIQEQGVDWGFLNSKRKEMLMVKSEIFPYVGSYKAIVNAINYFGYNDLELYEYYRNINIKSPNFDKLFKVEIPDIFDNTIPGFTVNDFLKNTMPNVDYEPTNLFNLTYNITDKMGNNVLLYSLSEVIIKLQGLKKWLESNVIPITHTILDITGRADFVGVNSIVNRNYMSKVINMKEHMTPIDFSINEAYLMPVNSGSTVYTVVIDFKVADANIPDYFNVKVRTYMTYPEWEPFVTYSIGDIVNYYNKIYISSIANNRINDPRKYSDATIWSMNIDYKQGEIVNYYNKIYEFQGTQSLFAVTQSIYSPVIDTTHWLDITQWEEINYAPIQTLSEYRTSTQSYIFTVDSNIDPFVSVEVTSDNGYGQIYTAKKNYEIRGLSSRSTVVLNIDPIGTFIPITPITTSP